MVLHGSGRLGVVVVARAAAGAFEHQLAHLVGSQGSVVVVHDSDIDEEVGPPNAARLAHGVLSRESKQTRPKLHHAESLLEPHALLPSVLLHQGHRQRRTATGAEAQAAQVGSLPVRSLRHHLIHGGHRCEDGDMLPLDQL